VDCGWVTVICLGERREGKEIKEKDGRKSEMFFVILFDF
jgi:hypothetical protein